MSKMSNLDLVLDEMITAGQKMIEAANELKAMFSETSELEPKKATKKKETTDEPATAPAETESPKTYTFTEVRGIMAALSGQGKKAEAKALLQKFGANRLSDLDEKDYAALVEEAQVIANAN